ncbi:MAG: cob(I)yrinic acid a,c-diamide adenosyltransferase [Candidatus Zixiibacteriota bacterium]|nr:MAG: cob(I)yrinic acid a,c-diamide adenosyltransferase [candidate division Zixibacteria bacterium]
MRKLVRGYVHVYTGKGKGKTTAALGLALRAAGAGLTVYIAQFVKGMKYAELNALKRFADSIRVVQFGRDCFIRHEPAAEDFECARRGFEEVKKVISSGAYQVVILDEVNIATHYGLITIDELLELMESRPDDLELVLTGRKADPRIIEKADLVTEMREVKHYYVRGVKAREGIEM